MAETTPLFSKGIFGLQPQQINEAFLSILPLGFTISHCFTLHRAIQDIDIDQPGAPTLFREQGFIPYQSFFENHPRVSMIPNYEGNEVEWTPSLTCDQGCTKGGHCSPIYGGTAAEDLLAGRKPSLISIHRIRNSGDTKAAVNYLAANHYNIALVSIQLPSTQAGIIDGSIEIGEKRFQRHQRTAETPSINIRIHSQTRETDNARAWFTRLEERLGVQGV
ncbi:MAG TPA: hypothetical protein VJB87_04470 [Candidatus Nanoarchaeia archaeon]|nr:hypothetical protein [Candidatus Nanoarchaeia archaeon]